MEVQKGRSEEAGIWSGDVLGEETGLSATSVLLQPSTYCNQKEEHP